MNLKRISKGIPGDIRWGSLEVFLEETVEMLKVILGRLFFKDFLEELLKKCLDGRTSEKILGII